MMTDYYLPPEIYRYIRLLSGKPTFRVNYNPKMKYAEKEVVHTVKKRFIKSHSVDDPLDCVYLYSGISSAFILGKKEVVLENDQFILLSHNQKLINIDINRVSLEYNRTKIYWLNWTNRSKNLHYTTQSSPAACWF
jgi:alpha,alpha-trehalase